MTFLVTFLARFLVRFLVVVGAWWVGGGGWVGGRMGGGW